ncbi:MAG TPA: GntR family transcriptional regulator [Acidimicrobiales bacterium]|nr:GntR family transcriptional regulator [Acidimicrobiales bacterium]
MPAATTFARAGRHRNIDGHGRCDYPSTMQGGIQTASIQAQVIKRVRDMILDGVLPPGASVSETSLAEEFGVSRTPIREALKQLETEGLLEVRPRVGTFVPVLSRRDLTELFQLKEILEGAAARLMAFRGRVPELTALERNVAESATAVANGHTESYVQLVQEFHLLIVKGADNLKLEAHYRVLMNQLVYDRLVRTSLALPGRILESEAEHEHIVTLIAAKDAYNAERFTREHVRASHQALMAEMLESHSPSSPPS